MVSGSINQSENLYFEPQFASGTLSEGVIQMKEGVRVSDSVAWK